MAFFELGAERHALGCQVLNPLGELADLVVRCQGQVAALVVADGDWFC
jgi:hypothetical protein